MVEIKIIIHLKRVSGSHLSHLFIQFSISKEVDLSPDDNCSPGSTDSHYCCPSPPPLCQETSNKSTFLIFWLKHSLQSKLYYHKMSESTLISSFSEKDSMEQRWKCICMCFKDKHRMKPLCLSWTSSHFERSNQHLFDFIINITNALTHTVPDSHTT